MEDPKLGQGKKNAQNHHAWVVFLDESGISQKPSIRRTWAPRNRTPVIRYPFNWKKLSICSAIGYRWDGRRCRLYFRIVAGSFTDEKLIEFLCQLRRQFRGQALILVWDGLPSHRSHTMSQYLQSQTQWLTVQRLPSYAPDLNPVESLWGNIQAKELANRSVDDLGGMVDGVREGFSRIDSQGELLQSFLKHAGLCFD